MTELSSIHNCLQHFNSLDPLQEAKGVIVYQEQKRSNLNGRLPLCEQYKYRFLLSLILVKGQTEVRRGDLVQPLGRLCLCSQFGQFTIYSLLLQLGIKQYFLVQFCLQSAASDNVFSCAAVHIQTLTWTSMCVGDCCHIHGRSNVTSG